MPASLQRIVNAQPPLGDGAAQPFDSGHLPSSISQAIWRGNEVGQATEAVVGTGFPALDAQLPGGGWPCNSLTELLQPQPSSCEWRLLAPALAGLVSNGGQILLVGPPKRPHAPGLAKLGITEKHLVWIAADTPAERLWTTEQLVKANPKGGAILAWLPQARSEQIRRLQVHAQSCDCPVFLFRPEAAQLDASPAPLRVLTTLGPDWELRVQILKRKGALMERAIALQSIPGTLESVFTPRLMHPSQLIAKTEATHVITLGSAATRRRLRQLSAH
ncbi:MAG: translesion DNA synthesis-associated protein ImuA [Pseudomonadota bacterium]